MKKFECMRITDGAQVIHISRPNTEIEKIYTAKIAKRKLDPLIYIINTFTNNGWRVVAVGPATTTAGLFTPSASTDHTVYLEREILEKETE
jgi:hypothetical protein